jgi:hypothetical protein
MMTTLPRVRALALGLVLPVVGCSAGGGAAITPQSQLAQPSSRLPLLRGPMRTADFLYVADGSGSSSSSSSSGNGAVTVYRVGNKTKLVNTIGDGISNPRGITLDGSNNLYVVNGGGSSSGSSSSGGGSVTVYAAGSGDNTLTITSGLNSPTAVAVDSNGFVYVANGSSSSSSSGSGSGSVNVYRPGHHHVFHTISNGIGNPTALAFDGQGNLYVLNSSTSSSSSSSGAPASVSVYGPRHTDPKLVISTGISAPSALAVDSAGDVVVANGTASSSSGSSSSGSVVVYTAGATSPAATITTGIANPRALAVDGAGDLFVANQSGSSSSSSSGSSGSVTVYNTGSSSPARTISDGVNNPNALALTAGGMLFVSNSSGSSSSSSSSNGTVTEYASRSTAVRRTITSHISDPVALGVSGP